MKIRRLYIGDFGILRNQTLEDLYPGLIVIGGLNRAGKSTFMEVLRYLGYGFPQNSKLPPSNGEGYEIEADLILDNQAVYNLRIHGYSEPVLTRISDKDNGFISARNLYGVDEFTYRQLFTISLQQLDKIPREISGKAVEKLQSILLGAGFTELIRLPILESEMAREAEKIGGKRGNPSVKLFKPYYQQIQDGIELKNKALEQVEIYQSRKDELLKVESLIQQKNEGIKKLQRLEFQMEAIKGNFSIYKAKKELELKMNIHPARDKVNGFPIHILERVKALQTNYRKLLEQSVQQAARFNESIGGVRNENIKEKLLELKQYIERSMAAISGIREQIRQYSDLTKECNRKRADLFARVKGLNREWREEDLVKIAALPIDGIEEGKFLESIERYKALMEERKNLKQSIDQMEENEKQLMHRLEKIETESPSSLLKKYLYGAIILILIGGFSAFINWSFGLLSVIAGIVGIGLYMFVRMIAQNGNNIRKQEMEAQLEEIRTRIDAAIVQNKSLGQEWRVLDATISEYRNALGLKPDITPDVLKEYFNAIHSIREKFLELNNIQDQVAQLEKWIKHRLKDLTVLLMDLEGKTFLGEEIDDESFISQSEYIFAALDKWHDRLKEALALEAREQERLAMEEQISHLINLWKAREGKCKTFEENLDIFIATGEKVAEYLDIQQEWEILNRQLIHSLTMERTRNAILASSTLTPKENYTEEHIVEEFERLCSKYGTIDEIEEECQKNKEKLQKEMHQLEELKERYLRLQAELRNLSTMENLERAQRQIDHGRSELRPMAYQYAVYSTAAFLISKVRQNLLDGVKDTVLGKAAQILQRMTNGDYVGILPPENWTEPDFKTVMGDGAIQESVDILSQGTREQLYLAVRISRILDIQPPLPVILDDCMANFDCRHVKQSLKMLSELAQTHQIFMLTCHPELVEVVADCTPNAQYWSLDRGRFALSNPDKLIAYLS